MSDWITTVPIFEGENEAALKAEFVKFSALYPNYSAFEIGEHVFRNLPDPISRGQQAGMVWGKDLSIRERIRLYNVVESEKPDTGEEKLIKAAWDIVNDPDAESRDKIKAIAIIAKMQGNLKKETDPAEQSRQVVDRPYSFRYVERDFNKPPPSDDDPE